MGAAALVSLNAWALQFPMDTLISGTPPAGTIPWMMGNLEDIGSGTVELTLSASGLTGSEYVSQWYFNVVDAQAGNLTFTKTASSGSFTGPSVSQGLDAYSAGGGGKYDIRLLFASRGGDSSTFGGGDSVTFAITSTLGGLSAADFDLPSQPPDGNGPTVAYVKGTGGGTGSAWIADDPAANNQPRVPDQSSTVMLLGIAMLAVEGLRRKFTSAKS